MHGRGSCPPTLLPTGFSEWGLSHISHSWNSSPHRLLVRTMEPSSWPVALAMANNKQPSRKQVFAEHLLRARRGSLPRSARFF